jgi:RNA polymerase sigma factor (sigma-70 family)
MTEQDRLVERFEADRPRLRGVAYRLLGSRSEAEDAVQEAWLHVARADAGAVDNLGGWLTTIVARVCLDMLRARRARRELLGGPDPEPIVVPDGGEADPEREALLADSVGLALLVLLETLAPAERLAFVLHDMFAVPFDEIAPIVGRTPAAARQLASRARRRLRGAPPASDAGRERQREVVDAFFAAARDGDFEALLAVLDPDVELHDGAGIVRGAATIARNAIRFSGLAPYARRALIGGLPGIVVIRDGEPLSLMAFTVAAGRIVHIDVIAEPERLRRLDLGAFGRPPSG